MADGHRPAFAGRLDPAEEPVDFRLEPQPSGPFEPGCVLKGRVLAPGGEPVVGATVTPSGKDLGGGRKLFGGMSDMDPLAITDADGEFHLVSRSPAQGYFARIRARALCPQVRLDLKPDVPNVIQLQVGGSVSGRLLHEGEPMAGVEVGLVQADRHSEHWVGASSIGTDEHGRFLFSNVPADQPLLVYGAMEGLKHMGALPVHPVSPVGDGQSIDAGDIELTTGLEVLGQVVLSDGKPIPPNTRITFSRELAFDAQMVELDEDGWFEVTGLPPEGYSVSVIVPGYSLSARNHSFDLLNGFSLNGRIEESIAHLVILLEPGDNQRVVRPDPQLLKDLLQRQKEQLGGIEEDR